MVWKSEQIETIPFFCGWGRRRSMAIWFIHSRGSYHDLSYDFEGFHDFRCHENFHGFNLAVLHGSSTEPEISFDVQFVVHHTLPALSGDNNSS